MIAYIVRRLLWMLVLLLAITAITFVIFNVLPAGDPAQQRAGRQPSPALVESIRRSLGLDKPKHEQFYNYVKGLSPVWVDFRHFSAAPDLKVRTPDFGYSYQSNTKVLPEILDRVPLTMYLTAGAVFIWLLVGIPVGMLSAIKSRTPLDRMAMGGALVAISAPVYFVGLVALYLFSKDIGLIPIFPGNSAYESATGFFGHVGALLLPWIVLATAFAAIYARFLRGNLIETMGEDYIRTARAKGLSERRVIFKHGVRSALTPIVTLLGLDIGLLLGGAILTETVFNIQGIGRFAFEAISRSDLPVIQGTVLFGAFFIVVMNLIVDILYAFLDPRVTY